MATAPLETTGIYGILPADLDTELLLAKAEAAMLGGVRILQLRDKKVGFKKKLQRAIQLRELTQEYNTTLIINDSVQVALESGADGVHLGRNDVADVSSIRKQVAEGFILGITCRADARYAKAALDFGANYVSFGAVFASSTKADVPVIGLPRLHKACSMFPKAKICAIGGINKDNIVMIKAAGATYAAVISSLFEDSTETIEDNAKYMVTLWENAPAP